MGGRVGCQGTGADTGWPRRTEDSRGFAQRAQVALEGPRHAQSHAGRPDRHTLDPDSASRYRQGQGCLCGVRESIRGIRSAGVVGPVAPPVVQGALRFSLSVLVNSVSLTGLVMYALAPWRMPHTLSVSWSLVVTSTTGMCEVAGSFEMARVAWKPFKFGITTSINTRSGLSRLVASTPAAPSTAVNV